MKKFKKIILDLLTIVSGVFVLSLFLSFFVVAGEKNFEYYKNFELFSPERIVNKNVYQLTDFKKEVTGIGTSDRKETYFVQLDKYREFGDEHAFWVEVTKVTYQDLESSNWNYVKYANNGEFTVIKSDDVEFESDSGEFDKEDFKKAKEYFCFFFCFSLFCIFIFVAIGTFWINWKESNRKVDK